MQRCSFCHLGAPPDRLIHGPDVFICDACVAQCLGVYHQECPEQATTLPYAWVGGVAAPAWRAAGAPAPEHPCSFGWKPARELRILLVARDGVAICDECFLLAVEIFLDTSAQRMVTLGVTARAV